MNFNSLISQISETHQTLQQSAVKAVNIHLTLRNWLIGFYIVEFEQKGEDRAKYGTKLLKVLTNELKLKNLKINERELRNFRTFYFTYSFFIDCISTFPLYSQIASKLDYLPIRGSVTPESNLIFGSATQESEIAIRGSATPELQKFEIQEDEAYCLSIFTQISYTHFVELKN